MKVVPEPRRSSAQVKILKERAAAFVAANRFKDAISVYDELRGIEPNEGEWPWRAADCCLRLKDQDRRLQYSVLAARAYAESGHLLKAIAMCKVSLSINPNHGESRVQLARLSAHSTSNDRGGAPEPPARGAQNMDAVRAMRLARERREGDPRVEPGDRTPRARARMAAAAAMRRARARKHLEEQIQPRGTGQEPQIAGQVGGKVALQQPNAAVRAGGAEGTPARADPSPVEPSDFSGADGEPSFRLPAGLGGSHPPLAAMSLSERVKTDVRASLAPGSGNVYSLTLKSLPSELGAAPLPTVEVEAALAPETPHPDASPVSCGESSSAADPGALLQDVLRKQDANRNALRRTPLFEALDEDLLEYLIEIIAVVELEAGETLFREGDIADAMYVIVEGSVVARAHPHNHPPIELAILEEGEFFGEIGLLSDQPRQAAVIAREHTRLLRFDRSTVGFMSDLKPEFLTTLLKFLKERLVENLMVTSPLFLPFDEAGRRALLEQFEFLEIEPNSVLLDHGQPPIGMYVLLSGQALLAQAKGRPGALRRLSPGDIFGEQALLYNQTSHVQVRTASKCFALCLPSDAFSELIMAQPTVLAYLANLGAEDSLQVAPDFLDHVSFF